MSNKIVQHRPNFEPYINDVIKDFGKQIKLKFNNNITTKSAYDWDDHNKSKIVYQKMLNLANPYIDNITATHSGISDHSMVSINLRTTGNVDNPKYHLTQNWKSANPLGNELLTSFNLF